MESDGGKLFIGGISWDTTEETLRDYFKRYGQVADAVIMRDRNTGSTRGFGFVGFTNPNDADRALQDKHALAGRAVEVKKAVPRRNQQNQVFQSLGGAGSNSRGSNTGHERTKKIFVGGLPANLTENEFRSYFEQFGTITDVVVMYDGGTQRPRGFGFITFETEEAVETVLQKSFHELNEKRVEVKRAVPKEAQGGGRSRGFGGAVRTDDNSYGAKTYGGYGPLGYVVPPIDGAYVSGGFGYGNIFPSAAPTQFGGGYANGPGVSSSWGAIMEPGYGCAGPMYGGGQNTPPVYGYGDGAYSSGGYGGRGGSGYGVAVGSYMGYGGADLSAGGGGVSFGGGDGGYGAAGRPSQRGPDTRFKPYPDRTA